MSLQRLGGLVRLAGNRGWGLHGDVFCFICQHII
jgi:hypothetical protein